MIAGASFAAGVMSFELISFHFATTGVVSGFWIPVFLALSTGFGVIVSLALGKLFDRFGLTIVLIAVLLSAAFSPLVFFGGFKLALVGILLWGIGYAGHAPEGACCHGIARCPAKLCIRSLLWGLWRRLG
jgi:hypothetical protein